MNRLFITLLLGAVAVTTLARTHITGTYDGGRYVVIHRAGPRGPVMNGTSITVPVENGRFACELDNDTLMVYSIQSDKNMEHGSFYNNYFFSEPTEISVTMIPEDGALRPEIFAPAGTLSNRVEALRKSISARIKSLPDYARRDSLEAAGRYYSPRLMEIKEQYGDDASLLPDSLRKEVERMFADDTWRTPEGTEAENRLITLFEHEVPQLELDIIKADTTLAGLFLLVNRTWQGNNTPMYVDAYEEVYRGLYPGHPYDRHMELLAATVEPVKGNRFIDFSAPDFEGRRHTLSELIAGRPALIDLWGSTCRPCRRNAIAMIPVYDKYAPKGFTIVGVAREFGSPDQGRKAAEKDGHKWIDLLELDDANGIFAKYRCANAMGATFLVDDKGVITAVNPTPEEVEAWLEEYYPAEGSL